MRVSVCVGDYATTPYCIAGLGIRVYCMEELCYCLRENAFLLDLSLLEEKLVDWIDRECGIRELARELYPMVRKQGSLSAFVTLILEYTGLYDSDTIRETERVLKEGSGLSRIEKRKNQIDYLVQKKKYIMAINKYDELLALCCEEGEGMSTAKAKAQILHNKGVAMACMMEYAVAADCFKEANDTFPDEESYQAYLAAKRMELSEEDYLAFVADQPECYEQSLKLEKVIEQLSASFPEQEAGIRIAELREWRTGSDTQKYYDEIEHLARVLKDNYRNSVSE